MISSGLGKTDVMFSNSDIIWIAGTICPIKNKYGNVNKNKHNT